MRRGARSLLAVGVACALWLTLPFGLRAGAQDATGEGPLPPGPHVDLVYAKCQVCHNLRYVTDSRGLPAFLWEDTINLMIQLGMQVSDDEKTRLLDYLSTYMGPNPPPEASEMATTATTDTDMADNTAPNAQADAAPDGEALYAANCASCHQPEGQGVANVFPPLVDHVPVLLLAEGGRDYLPTLLLYGLQGRIEVLGESYTNLMPAWAQLSDAELAAILNHALTAWGNAEQLPEDFVPYDADEVAAQRGLGIGAQEVLELRPDTGGR